MARALIGAEDFMEVYVDTPLAECERRDPKGLYRKARAGQLPNMTGVSSPYEPPLQPQCVIDTQQLSPAQAAERLAALLHAGTTD